jgi:predicted Fe-Mo cluster-binding NifX family protein
MHYLLVGKQAGTLRMIAAFAAWENRIAPVFDVVREICLVETVAGQNVRETQEILANDLPVQKALRLAELGVSTLVCGAISRDLYEMVIANGIRVIPFVAGDLREVIKAWLTGGLNRNVFSMPGCHGRHQFKGISLYREEQSMNRGSGMGGGRGSGMGGGRGSGMGGGRGSGRGRGLAGGPSDSCVCPQCGQKEQHERGVRCFEQKCPKCGTAMIREQKEIIKNGG